MSAMFEPDAAAGVGTLRVLLGPLDMRGLPMADATPLSVVTRWRTRAEEILAQAETMTDADARQEMREKRQCAWLWRQRGRCPALANP